MIKLTESNKGVILKIRVSPAKKAFRIRGIDSWSNSLLVDTKAPPEKGKANKEIEKALEKIFGKKTVIKSGTHSKNKTVLVSGKAREIQTALKQLAD